MVIIKGGTTNSVKPGFIAYEAGEIILKTSNSERASIYIHSDSEHSERPLSRFSLLTETGFSPPEVSSPWESSTSVFTLVRTGLVLKNLDI